MRNKSTEHRTNIGFVKYIILCCALGMLMVSQVHAQTDRERDPGYIFYKANALYEQGKYDEAIKVYSGLIDQGLESGNLYYNIGNSFFKKEELGRAILYYERAHKLIPGDSDLKSNYDFAVSKVRNPVLAKTVPFNKKMTALYNGVSIDGMSVLLSVIFVVLLSFVFIFFMVKPDVRYKTIAFVFLILFFLTTVYALIDRISADKREAVLIAESSDAAFEPVESATMHFTVYVGTKSIYCPGEKGLAQDQEAGWKDRVD